MDNNLLCMKMVAHNYGDTKRIQHFFKVHAFSKLIAQEEGMDRKAVETLEIAAITHDIGIRPAEEKYGSCAGNLQEIEGPPVAREMLGDLGYDSQIIDRVCWLIAHHHTYTNIDSLDYQILVEADFLVNMYEYNENLDTVKKMYGNIFKTKTGKKLCCQMFGFAEL